MDPIHSVMFQNELQNRATVVQGLLMYWSYEIHNNSSNQTYHFPTEYFECPSIYYLCIIIKLKMLELVARKLGVQQDLITLASLFFLNISLCHFWRLIHAPLKRKLFSLIGGISFLYLMLHQWSLYVIISALVMYFIISSQKKHYFWISNILGFGFLIIIHIYRTLYDHLSWKMDCSVMQMFLTTKVIYFGRYLEESNQKVSLLDFMSYSLFFPGVLIGPTFSYTTYQDFMYKKGSLSSITYPKIYKLVLEGVFWAILTSTVSSHFPSDWVNTSDFYKSSSLPVKLLIITCLGVVYRLKFYTGWAFTQAAINASGINSSQNLEEKVEIGSFRYQTQYNPRIKTLYWNKSISKWINNCFYQPLVAKYPKQKTLPLLASFIASALWHGIYLSYFLGFLHWAFLNEVSRFCYKSSHLVKRFENMTGYKVVLWILNTLILNYVGMMIVVLGTWNVFDYLGRIYWIGSFVIFGLYGFFIMNPRLMSEKTLKKQA